MSSRNSKLKIEIFRHYHIKELVEAVGVFEIFKNNQYILATKKPWVVQNKIMIIVPTQNFYSFAHICFVEIFK